jgi:hypothetical protein
VQAQSGRILFVSQQSLSLYANSIIGPGRQPL